MSICSIGDYSRNFGSLIVEKIETPLTIITGEKMKVLATIKLLKSIVVDTNRKFTPLLGRDWFDVLYQVNLLQRGLNEAVKIIFLNEIKPKYAVLFNDDFKSPLSGFKVNAKANKKHSSFNYLLDIEYKVKYLSRE
jgi:hypothetical protein